MVVYEPEPEEWEEAEQRNPRPPTPYPRHDLAPVSPPERQEQEARQEQQEEDVREIQRPHRVRPGIRTESDLAPVRCDEQQKPCARGDERPVARQGVRQRLPCPLLIAKVGPDEDERHPDH